MQITDLGNIQNLTLGTAVTYLLADRIYQMRSGRQNGAAKTGSDGAIALLAAEVKALRATLSEFIREAREHTERQWVMLHDLDKRLAVSEDQREGRHGK